MSNNIYFDTNIIVDIFDENRIFHKFSLKSLESCILDEDCKIFVNSDTMTNLFYILRAHIKLPFDDALEKLEFIKESFEIVTIDKDKISQAIEVCRNKTFDDYEDALQYICALSEDCELIVTNNIKDFKKCNLEISTSKEFVKTNE